MICFNWIPGGRKMRFSIHNTPKEFESGVLFLRLGLPFTVIVPSQKPSFSKMLFKPEESKVAGRAILKPGNRNAESGTRNPEPETRNPEPGIRNPEPGFRIPGFRVALAGLVIWVWT